MTRHDRRHSGVISESSKIMLHGYMTYICKQCGTHVHIGLEQGVEDSSNPDVHRVPTPFAIPCKCGGMAMDNGMHEFPVATPAETGMEYFAYPADPINQCAILSVKGYGPIKYMLPRQDAFDLVYRKFV